MKLRSIDVYRVGDRQECRFLTRFYVLPGDKRLIQEVLIRPEGITTDLFNRISMECEITERGIHHLTRPR